MDAKDPLTASEKKKKKKIGDDNGSSSRQNDRENNRETPVPAALLSVARQCRQRLALCVSVPRV